MNPLNGVSLSAVLRDAIDPDVYVSREYAPLEQRLKAYTVYAKAVPTAVEQIRKNLRTPLRKHSSISEHQTTAA